LFQCDSNESTEDAVVNIFFFFLTIGSESEIRSVSSTFFRLAAPNRLDSSSIESSESGRYSEIETEPDASARESSESSFSSVPKLSWSWTISSMFSPPPAVADVEAYKIDLEKSCKIRSFQYDSRLKPLLTN
jgi:hypothetical protein